MKRSTSTIYARRGVASGKGVIRHTTGTRCDGPDEVTRLGHALPWAACSRSTIAAPQGLGPVSYYRTLLGEFKPHIYKTDDYTAPPGPCWTDGKNGIPGDYPTCVVWRGSGPRRSHLRGDGVRGCHPPSTRQDLAELPAQPARDPGDRPLKVHRGDLTVSTMGRSMGFRQRGGSPPAREGRWQPPRHLLAPPTAYRFHGYDVMNGPADPQFIELARSSTTRSRPMPLRAFVSKSWIRPEP